uniref:Uncharacterized protein n=1 Tax=Candidatus Kentrum sp. UNK TaxID=2126344 RepID=A0A451B1X1_9GAMM|nr:MAG: hypothetical protein BECKUNK1418G_GA0071005_11131 [Candidatus Kentron sp. UNK]VFK72288.1 MAG: hypothetical protein BECKUNK1418H_GA0071006_11061 [Candidatus Kentron sp. UNK]
MSVRNIHVARHKRILAFRAVEETGRETRRLLFCPELRYSYPIPNHVEPRFRLLCNNSLDL